MSKIMKIKDIIGEEELNKIDHWGDVYCIDCLDAELAKHYPEMEIKEYILYRILMELEDINLREEERYE